METTVISQQIRVVVYFLDDGRKEVFIIGNAAENEQHERASAEREMHNPESHIVSFEFQWRDAGSIPANCHSWYE